MRGPPVFPLLCVCVTWDPPDTGGPRITRFFGERKYRAMRNRVMRGPL